MEDFIRRFLHARDGDLPPFDSWRRRNKASGKRSRFEVGLTTPLEQLARQELERVLLEAAESRAMIAWLYARYSCDDGEAMRLYATLVHECLPRPPFGDGAALCYGTHIAMQVPLFSLYHIPKEEHEYLSLADVKETMSSLGYLQGTDE